MNPTRRIKWVLLKEGDRYDPEDVLIPHPEDIEIAEVLLEKKVNWDRVETIVAQITGRIYKMSKTIV